MKPFAFIGLLIWLGYSPCQGQNKEKKLENKLNMPDSRWSLDSLDLAGPQTDSSEVEVFQSPGQRKRSSLPVDIPNSYRQNEGKRQGEDTYTPELPLSGDTSVPMPGTESLDTIRRGQSDDRMMRKDTLMRKTTEQSATGK